MATRRKIGSGEEKDVLETKPFQGSSEQDNNSVSYAEPGIAWGNVIRDVLRIDNPAWLAKRLRGELTLSDEGRSSYGSLLAALDRSARNYDDAYMLYRGAKVEESRFALELRERFEVMKEHASSELMDEYKEKKRRSPTTEDIEDRMMSSWPDEYRHLRTKEAELHAAVRSLETLAKAWSSRCADLRAMADMFTARKNG
jgi:hypothetical protein